MQKSKYLILVSIIVILGAIIVGVHAQQIPQQNNDAQPDAQITNPLDTIDITKDIIDTAKSKESRAEFLKEAWSKTLEKTSLGKVLKKLESIFQSLDPVFKIFFGVGFSLSWFFLLIVLTWLLLLKIVVDTSSLLDLYLEEKLAKYIKGIIISGWIIIISSVRLPKSIADGFINLVAKISSLFGQIIFLTIISSVLIALMPLLGRIRKAVKAVKLKKDAEEGKKESKKNKKEIKDIQAENAEEKKAQQEEEGIKKQAKEDLEGIEEP